jgi:hypothetical protein
MLDLPHIAPSLNPSFTPLAGAPKEVHDTIWGRILYFALSVPELAENPAPRHVPRRLPILLVSKTFNVRSSNKFSLKYVDMILTETWTASLLFARPVKGPVGHP